MLYFTICPEAPRQWIFTKFDTAVSIADVIICGILLKIDIQVSILYGSEFVSSHRGLYISSRAGSTVRNVTFHETVPSARRHET